MLDWSNREIPSFKSPPAIVWMFILGSVLLLLVLAKVFATVSVGISAGVKG